MWGAVSVVRVPFVGFLCCFWLSGLAWADETANTIREEGVETVLRNRNRSLGGDVRDGD